MCESGSCTNRQRATGVVKRTVSIYGRSGAIITVRTVCKYIDENILLSILSREDRLLPVCTRSIFPSIRNEIFPSTRGRWSMPYILYLDSFLFFSFYFSFRPSPCDSVRKSCLEKYFSLRLTFVFVPFPCRTACGMLEYFSSIRSYFFGDVRLLRIMFMHRNDDRHTGMVVGRV